MSNLALGHFSCLGSVIRKYVDGPLVMVLSAYYCFRTGGYR